ncbi:hypothetical protein MAH4_32460 [Sessilibacter sp. MAH4]
MIYTNQVGGTACLHPQVEGIFAPIEYDIPLAHPEDTLESKLAYLLCNYDFLPSKKADELDELFSIRWETKCLTVDRSKLDLSCEAWVYVLVDAGKCDLFSGDAIHSAILTWSNSD